MKDTGNERSKTWKIIGTVSVALIAVVSTLYFVKYDFIPNFNSWVNPFYVKEIKEEPKTPETQEPERPTPESLLLAVNEVRAKAGVAPLKLDPRLNTSAQIKADDMKNRGYFGHKDPEGRKGTGIAHTYLEDCEWIGENLTDSGTPSKNTLANGIDAWVNSPTHYEVMTDPGYTLTGFGITSTGLVEHFCQL